MPFLLRRNTFNAAIEKGIMFEINYSSAIIDEKKRKVVYQNAIQIIKQLRAKNVIISSNIKDILFHRSPNEVIILYN
jgi:ribonuclease P/MRP protein subunit RPP1